MSGRRCTLEFVRQQSEPAGWGFTRPEWFWRFKAVNGKETARSSETYRNRVDAIRSAELTTGCFGIRACEAIGKTDGCYRPGQGASDERVNVRWIRS